VALVTPASTSQSSLLDAPPTTSLYTLSLHDALPIYLAAVGVGGVEHLLDAVDVRGEGRDDDLLLGRGEDGVEHRPDLRLGDGERSEEHTSELQSRENLVCRLLLEKKKRRDSASTWCG